MNKLIIKITPADAKVASTYDSNDSCLLATAIKRQLNLSPEFFSVGSFDVDFYEGEDFTRFGISNRGMENLRRAYCRYTLTRPKVQKPFSVTLTQIPIR